MKTLFALLAIPVLVVSFGLGCGSTPAPQEPVTDTQQPASQKSGGQPQSPAEAEVSDDDIVAHAFPPTIPDTDWHRDAWWKNDCLRCHETGVQDAPVLEHRGMPDILKTAKCRTCHVLIPGSKPRPRPAPPSDGFAPNAFPPMIPASDYHADAWLRNDCLLCHESGIKGAPAIVHEGMSHHLLTAKCRTCHVQARSAGLPAAK